jgi:hypothetical protein
VCVLLGVLLLATRVQVLASDLQPVQLLVQVFQVLRVVLHPRVVLSVAPIDVARGRAMRIMVIMFDWQVLAQILVNI